MTEGKLPKDGEFDDGKIWFSRRGNVLTLGLTSHGVEQLGDLEKIELPEDGDLVEEGDAIITIEGTQDSLDIALDSKGVVLSVNPSASDLSLVTEDPLEEGWLVKFQVDDLEAIFGE